MMKQAMVTLTEDYVRFFHLHFRYFIEALAMELEKLLMEPAYDDQNEVVRFQCKLCHYPEIQGVGFHHLFGCQTIQHVQEVCWKRMEKADMNIKYVDYCTAMRWIMREPFEYHEGTALRVKLMYLDCLLSVYNAWGLKPNLRARTNAPSKVCTKAIGWGSYWEREWYYGLKKFYGGPGEFSDAKYPWARYGGAEPGSVELFPLDWWRQHAQ